MALNERQEAILKALRTTGEVEVDTLSRAWTVTTQTIRRDLGELCALGLALRTHGGAKRMPATAAIAYEDRRLSHTEAKSRVAQAAADLVPNGASVALNIGTTTELVAEALRLHRDLTVVSNNMNIVPILRASRLKSLILIGGEVRLADGAIVGETAVRAIANYKVDLAIIGASSLDSDGSVLDFDEREVAVAHAILANARQRVLVADISKFDVTAPYRICQGRDLDHVILDAEPPQRFRDALQAGATQLTIAGGTDV